MLILRLLPTEDDSKPFVRIHYLVETLEARPERAYAFEYLESLPPDKQAEMYARFHKLEGFLALPIWRSVGEWFKPLTGLGDAWEVGDDNRVRFYGFRHGAFLVLAHGAKKSGKKTPKADEDTLVSLRDRFKAQGG